eukprot:4601586-Prorocentrum_lima.AAC.1
MSALHGALVTFEVIRRKRFIIVFLFTDVAGDAMSKSGALTSSLSSSFGSSSSSKCLQPKWTRRSCG